MELFLFFISAYVLGLSVAAPIGPINVEIIRRALTFGSLPAFVFGCGASAADCTYFGLALLAARRAYEVLESEAWMRGGLCAGGAMLLLLGSSVLRSARVPNVKVSEDAPAKPAQKGWRATLMTAHGTPLRDFLLGYLLTLGNPMTILLWTSIAASWGAGSTGSADGGSNAEGVYWVGVAGVAGGTLSWAAFVVLAVAWARRWVGPKAMRFVNFASGGLLIAFGLRFLWRAVLG